MRSLAFAALLLFAMCAPSTRYTADALPDEHLAFSFGGGFTGEYQEYLLLPNGQLFGRRRVVSEVPYREFEGVEAKVAKDLVATYARQGFGALGYDDPGNITYTVEHVAGADTSRVRWGGTAVKPTEELRTYWRRLMAAIEGKERLPEASPSSAAQ